VAAREAARLVGLSLASWYRLRAAGRVGPAEVRLGGRVLFRAAELAEWVAAGCPDRKTWEALRAANGNGRR
jgi:predicted DNA-binding transcriptional regulator AlpA